MNDSVKEEYDQIIVNFSELVRLQKIIAILIIILLVLVMIHHGISGLIQAGNIFK